MCEWSIFHAQQHHHDVLYKANICSQPMYNNTKNNKSNKNNSNNSKEYSMYKRKSEPYHIMMVKWMSRLKRMKRKNNFNERNLLWWEIKRNVLCVCCRPKQMIVVFRTIRCARSWELNMCVHTMDFPFLPTSSPPPPHPHLTHKNLGMNERTRKKITSKSNSAT